MPVKTSIKAAFLVVLVAWLCACNPEKKLSRGFISATERPALYITFASDWQLFYNKPAGNSSSESFARRYFPYRTYSLKNNGTSQVDSLFKNSLTETLSHKGFKLYSDSSVNDFLTAPNDKFIIEFLQMYIEESTMPMRDTMYFADNKFITFDTVISRFDLSFWLCINPVDDTLTAAPVLYASFPLIDFFMGGWDYDISTDQYSYSYRFTPFEMSDVYSFFNSAGSSIANYTYDYFLNLYLFDRMRRKPNAYYSLNGSSLRKAGKDRFIFMKQQ